MIVIVIATVVINHRRHRYQDGRYHYHSWNVSPAACRPGDPVTFPAFEAEGWRMKLIAERSKTRRNGVWMNKFSHASFSTLWSPSHLRMMIKVDDDAPQTAYTCFFWFIQFIRPYFSFQKPCIPGLPGETDFTWKPLFKIFPLVTLDMMMAATRPLWCQCVY